MVPVIKQVEPADHVQVGMAPAFRPCSYTPPDATVMLPLLEISGEPFAPIFLSKPFTTTAAPELITNELLADEENCNVPPALMFRSVAAEPLASVRPLDVTDKIPSSETVISSAVTAVVMPTVCPLAIVMPALLEVVGINIAATPVGERNAGSVEICQVERLVQSPDALER